MEHLNVEAGYSGKGYEVGFMRLHFFFFFLKIYLFLEREREGGGEGHRESLREKHQFVVSLIYAFISCFLCVS